MPTLNDIIKQRKGQNEFFNTYRPSEEIGEKIFNSFIKQFEAGKGFPLSEEKDGKEKAFGTISNAMAVSTILELEDMGANIDSFRNEFNYLLKTVIESVYRFGINSSPIFDASPYIRGNEDGVDQIYSYVETASKVMIIMIDLRNFANKHDIEDTPFEQSISIAGKTISSYAELSSLAEKVLVDSMKFLTDSVLKIDAKSVKKRQIDGKDYFVRANIPVDISYRGWTFCAPENDSESFDTSIYFTYHATNAYVSLYNAYPGIIGKIFSNDRRQTDDLKNIIFDTKELNNVEKELHERNVKFVINNADLIDKFRIMTASSGRYIEAKLLERGTDLTFDFVRSDFSGISSSRVLDMQDNNAVINTLFILAIYLNAGIDEDYEAIGAEKKDWFYNQLQFSISNIRKIYNILEADGKQDLIDSFRLDKALFSEKYPSSYKPFVRQFRKACENVVVYDLIPLLCNTYSIVFDFLIQYPQLEMTQNLDLIMRNCSSGDEWLWGDDNGFNINNHLYYVVALEGFYKYYSDYEEPLSGNEKSYNLIVKKNNEQNEAKLVEEREKIIALEAEIEKLRTRKSELDNEVERLAVSSFDKIFKERISEYLGSLSKKAVIYYLNSRKNRMTQEQIVEDLKNNEELRIAFALFGSINFNEQLTESLRDRVQNNEYDDYYKTLMEENIIRSVVSQWF